jgi:hypothetical protein
MAKTIQLLLLLLLLLADAYFELAVATAGDLVAS